MSGTSLRQDETVATLVLLMRATAERELGGAVLRIDRTMELGDIPITSRAMRAFLVGVEDEFDFEWDIDTPEEVFRSFSTLAAHLIGALSPKEVLR